MFQIATWNVNSLRVRLPQVLAWLKEHQPDVLALQETKLPDEDFPIAEIEACGYTVCFSGQRTYNGVAVLSRKNGSEIITDFPTFEDHQRRILAVTIGAIRVLNFYVPNGESVLSPKYQYKLTWLEHAVQFLRNELKTYPKLIVLGDFNIAPEECDVHDPKRWEGQVLFSVQERKALRRLIKTGLQDCFRLHAQSEQSFTWWDYRMSAFKRDWGLRIDHIFVSEELAECCHRCYIDKTVRAAERPSDHAIVAAEFSGSFR